MGQKLKMEPSSSSSELLEYLSPAVATLWQQMCQSSSSARRRKGLDVSGDDFRTYTVTLDVDAASSSSTFSSRKDAPSSTETEKKEPNLSRLITKGISGVTNKKVVPSNAVAPTPPAEGTSTTTTPLPAAAPFPPRLASSPPRRSKSKSIFATRSASSSTWDPLDGYAAIYFHVSPPVLTSVFFDEAGPLFLFGAAGGRSDAPPSSSSRQSEKQVFGPIVLERFGTDEMILLMYKRLQRNSKVVAELVSRVVRLDPGDDNGVASSTAIYFEAVDEEQLSKEAFKTVQEKRVRVRQDFDIVAAKELGCLVLVSRRRWRGEGGQR